MKVMGRSAFGQLVELLNECSRLNRECQGCPKLLRCLAFWDEVVVSRVSPRDRLIITEAEAGMPMGEIAEEVGVSARTVQRVLVRSKDADPQLP